MLGYVDQGEQLDASAAWAWVIEIQTDEHTWKIVNAGESELDAELTYYAEKARFANRKLRIRKAKFSRDVVEQAA